MRKLLRCRLLVVPLGRCRALLDLGLERGDEVVQLGVIAAERGSIARRAPRHTEAAVVGAAKLVSLVSVLPGQQGLPKKV